MKLRLFTVGLLILASLGQLAAQPFVIPIDQEITREVEWDPTFFSQRHTTMRPFVTSRDQYSLIRAEENEKYDRKLHKSWVLRKLLDENLVRVDTQGLWLEISPLVHWELGRDQEDAETTNYLVNTRGFDLRGALGDKLFFQSGFYENQAIFPGFIDSLVRATAVAPGSGRVKVYNETGWDFSQANGFLTFLPTKNFTVQAGHGKHFIGEGYRSFFLSDNSFNYPFLRTTTTLPKWHIQYDNLWTSLQNLERIPRVSTPEGPFQRKAGTFHHLSFKPSKWIDIGLFEAVMWQRWDTAGTTDYNPAIANPVMFVGTLLNGLQGENNAAIGVDASFRLPQGVLFYGQMLLDNADETAWQIGVKSYDLVKGLFVRLEHNQAARGAFDHQIPLQNFGHHGQPLGHQLGSGFSENLVEVRYRFKSFFAQIQAVAATYGMESDSIASGRDIFRATDPALFAAEPVELNLQNVDFRIGYLVNPITNLQWYVGVRSRQEGDTPGGRTTYVYGALRSALSNFYSDF